MDATAVSLRILIATIPNHGKMQTLSILHFDADDKMLAF